MQHATPQATTDVGTPNDVWMRARGWLGGKELDFSVPSSIHRVLVDARVKRAEDATCDHCPGLGIGCQKGALAGYQVRGECTEHVDAAVAKQNIHRLIRATA